MSDHGAAPRRAGRPDDRPDGGRQRDVLLRARRGGRRRRLRLLAGPRLRDRRSRTGTRWSTPTSAALLKKTAIILSKRIGGTSGPIWGTAFLRAGGGAERRPGPSGEQVVAALRAAIEGIKQRGKHRSGRQDAARRARPGGRRARSGAARGRGRGARAGRAEGARRAPRRRRACSPSAGAPPTRANAAATRSTRARSASRSCSRPSARRGSRPSWSWPDGRSTARG